MSNRVICTEPELYGVESDSTVYSMVATYKQLITGVLIAGLA